MPVRWTSKKAIPEPAAQILTMALGELGVNDGKDADIEEVWQIIVGNDFLLIDPHNTGEYIRISECSREIQRAVKLVYAEALPGFSYGYGIGRT